MHPAPQSSQSPYFPHSQPGSYALRLSGYLHVQGAQVRGAHYSTGRREALSSGPCPPPAALRTPGGDQSSHVPQGTSLCQRCGSPENRNCRTQKTKEKRTLCQKRSGEAGDWVWASSLVYCVISRKSLPLSVPLTAWWTKQL